MLSYFSLVSVAYKSKTFVHMCILHVKYVGSTRETHKVCVKYTDFTCVFPVWNKYTIQYPFFFMCWSHIFLGSLAYWLFKLAERRVWEPFALRFQSDGHATRSTTKQQRRIAELCLCLWLCKLSKGFPSKCRCVSAPLGSAKPHS